MPSAVCMCLNSCPLLAVHGVWEEWSPWSLCSFTCGRGHRTRTRMCTPPQHGGRACEGPETQSKLCNIALCPGLCASDALLSRILTSHLNSTQLSYLASPYLFSCFFSPLVSNFLFRSASVLSSHLILSHLVWALLFSSCIFSSLLVLYHLCSSPLLSSFTSPVLFSCPLFSFMS